MKRRFLLPVLLTTACSRGESRVPATPESPATQAAPLAWAFDAPAVWGDRVRLEDATEATRHLSARVFNYLPRDTTIAPQGVLGIVVFDSAQWARARAEEGPPPGDSLASVNGQVFVASLPQSNPFAPASADFLAFDSLTVTLDAVRRTFRVLP